MARRRHGARYLEGMASDRSSAASERIVERRLARARLRRARMALDRADGRTPRPVDPARIKVASATDGHASYKHLGELARHDPHAVALRVQRLEDAGHSSRTSPRPSIAARLAGLDAMIDAREPASRRHGSRSVPKRIGRNSAPGVVGELFGTWHDARAAASAVAWSGDGREGDSLTDGCRLICHFICHFIRHPLLIIRHPLLK
jgi:hypothetical protein